MTTIRFTYLTGVRRTIWTSATLSGSWNAEGHYAGQWTNVAMRSIVGPDGCPAFTVDCAIQGDPQRVFCWGVRLQDAAGSAWGIMAEIADARSTDRVRQFRLSDAGVEMQEYAFNQSRQMGAHRFGKGIRFSVWAPNAKSVEVVLGNLWQQGNDSVEATLITPANTPALQSSDRTTICGGYIADSGGDGSVSGWGPFTMYASGGVWRTAPDDPALDAYDRFDHLPYMFRVTKDDGSIVYKSDLYSRCQIGFGTQEPNGPYKGLTGDLDGKVSCSVVVNPDKVAAKLAEPVWPEKSWLSSEEFFATPAPAPGMEAVRLRDLVIYELHLGALGIQRGSDQAGTMEDACTFLNHLCALGVNAVELLPLAEFGGTTAGWGYATTHYHAVEYSGGGRDQYKWFVRECHNRGIAVILDVVFNHYNNDASRAEWMYDTQSDEKNSYYWYEGSSTSYPAFDAVVPFGQRGQGGYVDNLSSGWAPRYWEEQVRNLFISSAIALIEEFQVDGLRVDQTTSIRNYNCLHSDGRVVESANVAGTKFLRELTRTLRLLKPDVLLIAEDHADWEGVSQPIEEGGLGFDAYWCADFYHHLMGDTDKPDSYAKLIKRAGLGGNDPLPMDVFARQLVDTARGSKVVYNESHDEAGNGHGTDRSVNVAANGAPLVGDTRRYAEARCRFAAGMTMLSAAVPMFLFGEEVASSQQFLYNHVLDHRDDFALLRQTTGAGMFHFYSELIGLRLRNPGLRTDQLEVVATDNATRILAFRRWSGQQHFFIAASLNNSAFDRPGYTFRSDALSGSWKEVFNSDATPFGGDNTGNEGATIAAYQGTFACVVPANGFVVFESVSA